MKKMNIIITVFAFLAAEAVSAQENSRQKYKIILKRPIENNAQTIADKGSIKELLEFERFSRDNKLWDEMKKCYADDSRVNISWFKGSGHGFADASASMTMRSLHRVLNTEIWTNGDKAVALMMANLSLQQHIGKDPVELVSDVILVFRTQKLNGQWYIVSFETIYQQDNIIPQFPNADLNIPFDEISQYRESYRGMIYLNRKAKLKIDENLAGTDRPESVEKLYKEADEWLSK